MDAGFRINHQGTKALREAPRENTINKLQLDERRCLGFRSVIYLLCILGEFLRVLVPWWFCSLPRLENNLVKISVNGANQGSPGCVVISVQWGKFPAISPD
jgi:hypothetical protein